MKPHPTIVLGGTTYHMEFNFNSIQAIMSDLNLDFENIGQHLDITNMDAVKLSKVLDMALVCAFHGINEYADIYPDKQKSFYQVRELGRKIRKAHEILGAFTEFVIAYTGFNHTEDDESTPEEKKPIASQEAQS
jgi:hypothetical protein